MVDSAIQSLRDAIDEAISKSGQTVVDRVKDHYVDAEIKRRAEMLVAGRNLLREAELDVRKIDKPDVNHFSADGATVNSFYTKGALDKVKKAKERVERLTKALDAVLGSHSSEDYKKLDEAMKKSRGGGDGKPDTESPDTET